MTLIVWCVLYLISNIVVVDGDCLTDFCDPDSCYQSMCRSCVSGHYLNSGLCLPCEDDCTACDGASSCTECTKGYWGYLCQLRCTAGCSNGCSITTGSCSSSLDRIKIAGGIGTAVFIIIIICIGICCLHQKRNKDERMHQTERVRFSPDMPGAFPAAMQPDSKSPNPVIQPPQYTPQAHLPSYSIHVNPAFNSNEPPAYA